jgi:hypothetical protein
MSDPQTTKPIDFVDEFLSWHRPVVAAGDYTIQVKQTVVAPGIPTNDPGFGTSVMSFSVQGERFVLPPAEVHAVFPPDASMGDHAAVLPHVVLRRSTLPWERKADPNDKATPWLALLVFHDDEFRDGEVSEATTMSLSKATVGARFPAYKPEPGQTADDQVTVIDVNRALLETMVPNAAELTTLTHVRRRGDVEFAVVVSKRLPKPGGFSTAHLVSLEERFKGTSFDFGADADAKIRLISLVSFRFGCIDEKRSFTNLLRSLHGAEKSSLGSSTLRLRDDDYPRASDAAKQQLALGSVPLRHSRRNGQQTVSWYHGPLAPAVNPLPSQTVSPVQVSDELLRHNSKTGMFDVSYAAAWEIGRLAALQDKKFSVALYHWKQDQTKLQQLRQHPLANINAPGADTSMPQQLRTWFEDLSLLKGVPFSYLVPDERMLTPTESIRIFWLDWYWIECLIAGALSIGGQADANTIKNPHPVVTGIMLRSEVVSGWPGLQVDGYDKNGALLTTLRTDRLSPNVLICMFGGEIAKISFHQKVETLHFGLDLNGTKLVKKLRNGKEVEIPFKEPTKRLLDLDPLLEKLKQATSAPSRLTPAQFALQMIARIEEVSFSIAPPTR